PGDIPGVNQKTKPRRRLLSASQQHEDQNAVSQVEDEQPISCPRIPEFSRIHPDRYQRRNCQKHPGGGQPSLDPARLPRIGRDSESPRLTIALNARIQSLPPPGVDLRCILLNKKSLPASTT